MVPRSRLCSEVRVERLDDVRRHRGVLGRGGGGHCAAHRGPSRGEQPIFRPLSPFPVLLLAAERRLFSGMVDFRSTMTGEPPKEEGAAVAGDPSHWRGAGPLIRTRRLTDSRRSGRRCPLDAVRRAVLGTLSEPPTPKSVPGEPELVERARSSRDRGRVEVERQSRRRPLSDTGPARDRHVLVLGAGDRCSWRPDVAARANHVAAAAVAVEGAASCRCRRSPCKGPRRPATMIPRSKFAVLVSASGLRMRTFAVASLVALTGAAAAAVAVRASAATVAASDVKRRILVIFEFPTGSTQFGGCPTPVRSSVAPLLTVPAYGFPQGLG